MAENLPDTNVGNIDYIRREDAKDALQEKVFHNLTDEFYGAMQVLDELEPADVVQVVHSEWIYHMSYGVCKKCGYEYEWKGTDAKNYCPNCGAKMDGGDEHG